ncbi:MAG: UDP-3-O-(3-hydroxymyristoyl)glucosamine N-acyltransferase [Bacteroidetes bacterium]|nr:MAG: UDP-3-O-(3-hydroxymyristoyl)glucosamine N-acyltransferase [Bacteroidota bacterium]
MKFPRTYTLQEIADILHCKYVGEKDFPVQGLNEIHVAEQGDIVFTDHPKYYQNALQSAASVVLINRELEPPEGKALLISEDPFRDFNKLIRFFYQPEYVVSDYHFHDNQIGENTIIEEGAHISKNVIIGSNCVIHSGVKLYPNTVLGDNVIIHANTTVGADAFYYQKRQGKYYKLYSCGRVIIENDVEIGANCTIDKGVTGDTVIGSGTKIDNHVHIGHDTRIGKNCLFAAQVGISGAVVIEDEVTLWGQVGITSGITIGKGAVVLAQSGVDKSLKGGVVYFGSPASEARVKMKELAALRKLPSVIQQL